MEIVRSCRRSDVKEGSASWRSNLVARRRQELDDVGLAWAAASAAARLPRLGLLAPCEVTVALDQVGVVHFEVEGVAQVRVELVLEVALVAGIDMLAVGGGWG